MPQPHHLGGKIGPRIAEVVTDAQASHLRKTAHTRARIEAEGKHIFWRDIAAERDAHLRPLLDLLTGHPETHPAAEQMLQFMRSHQGELAGMLLNRTLGTAAATGVLAGVSNLLAPVNQRIIAAQPNTLLEPGQLAQLVESSRLDQGDAEAEAARGGIAPRRFHQLMQLARNYPDLPTALELWRRGLIGELDVLRTTQFAAIPEPYARQLLALKRAILAPADLALMRLRGIIDDDTGKAIAAENGVSGVDFDRLVLATGEPPGLEQLLEAFRRGFIDKQRLDRGIKQSRVRDEWADVVERLRFEPMATADAVEAVVRNYISAEDGKAIAEQNGLEPSQWQTLLLAHGRPPGLGQMFSLLNRGLVSQEQVDQAIRESDIKDKYIPHLRGLRYKIPGERALIMLLKDGAITEHRAHELLEKDGYEPDVAGAILHAGVAQRTQAHKTLALSEVRELYEDHAIDGARAEQLIVALGYPRADVPLILEVSNLRRERKYRDQAIAAVRSAYLAHHIDANEASAELGALGVPAAQVAYLLRIWAVELRGRRKTLTEAQIVHGYRAGALSAEDTVERLTRLGYHADDARFLVDTAGPIPRGK